MMSINTLPTAEELARWEAIAESSVSEWSNDVVLRLLAAVRDLLEQRAAAWEVDDGCGHRLGSDAVCPTCGYWLPAPPGGRRATMNNQPIPDGEVGDLLGEYDRGYAAGLRDGEAKRYICPKCKHPLKVGLGGFVRHDEYNGTIGCAEPIATDRNCPRKGDPYE